MTRAEPPAPESPTAPPADTRGTQGTFRQLWDLALPAVGLNLLAVTSLAVDTIMCGRLDNGEAVLTALGFATQVVFLLLVIMIGLLVGTVALVARAYGAGDHEQVNHVFRQSVTLTVVIGLLVALVGNLLAGPILAALGASPPIVEQGLEYLRPMLAGTAVYYLMLLYGAVLRGVGNTRMPFMVGLISNILNVVLNYGLILGNWGFPQLGVQGAAIGTLIAYASNLVIIVIILHRGGQPGLKSSIIPTRIDKKLAKILFKVGAPASLDMLVLNVAFVAMVGMIGRLDEVAVAAHGVGIRIQALAFVPGLGISQATAALVGQALGAGNPDRARATTRVSVFLCAAVMTSLGLLIIAGSEPIIALFDIQPDTPLQSYAIEWMWLLGFCMTPVGIQLAFSGTLQGAGATGTSLRINAIGTFLVQVPLAVLLAFPLDLGVFGVWLSFPLSLVAKAALAWLAYRQGAWAKVGTSLS